MDAIGRKDTDQWVPLSVWNWADYLSEASRPFEDIKRAKIAWLKRESKCRAHSGSARFAGLTTPYLRLQRYSPAPTHLHLRLTSAKHLAEHPEFLDLIHFTFADYLLPCGLPPVLRGLIVEII